MAPPPSATATATAPVRRPAPRGSVGSAAPARRPSHARAGTATKTDGRRDAAARSKLSVLAPNERKGERGASTTPRPVAVPARSGRALTIVSISLVVGALLAVVLGQAFLAKGQIRLAGLQHDISAEQSVHRQDELAVAELETPARIVAAAVSQLHMVRPAQIVELPYVSLTTPLATPKATAAPPPPAATTPTTTTPTTGSSSQATSGTASTSNTASTGTSGASSAGAGAGGTTSTTP